MTDAPVLCTVADGVATITLNVPEQRNALSATLIAGLDTALDRALSDEARCVVLASSHASVWCAGGDLNTFRSDTPLIAKHLDFQRLVNRVVAPEALDATIAEWAQSLASKSPLLVQMGKRAMAHQRDLPLHEALEYLRSQLSLAQATDDITEGLTAFFEKREPVWSGR